MTKPGYANIPHQNAPAPRAKPSRPKGRGVGAFRGEVVKLHRSIFRRSQKRINASVHGYTDAFRKYEREYGRYVRRYQRRATIARLDQAIAKSDLIYVGDYHTLPQAQRAFLRLLRRRPSDKPVVLALEFVLGKYQDALDAYMADEIDDQRFLEQIDHDEHWLFGGWEGFRDVFALAKSRGYPVIGIDTAGKGLAGDSLHDRDDYAATRIAQAHETYPEAQIIVLIGELHIAPNHLPRAVQKKIGPNTRKQLIVYQNCEAIYWQLEAKGLEHKVEIVQISKEEYCLLNTPPIVCQQSFLNWLQVDDEGLQLDAPEENFKEFARLISAFFDLELKDALDEIEVATVADLTFLRRLQRRGDFSKRDMAKIREQILRSESYYIPRANMVYLGNLSVNHAAEEATHFLRNVCSQSHEPRMLVDAFYARAIEEAVGFLGSKLMNHKRKCAHVPFFERQQRGRNATRKDKEIARLICKHARMMQGERVRNSSSIYECSADAFNAITHALGYQLGDHIYYGLIDGIIDKSEVRELFFEKLDEEGDALLCYLNFYSKTRSVKIPERF